VEAEQMQAQIRMYTINKGKLDTLTELSEWQELLHT
jgi:hypothetical protein